MSDKETLRQRVTRGAFSTLQFILELVAILLLFGIGLGLFLILRGGFNIIPSLGLIALLFGFFLAFEFAATELERKLQQLKHEKATFMVLLRKNLKSSSYLFLLILSVFAGVQILDNYFSLFPPTVSISLDLEILKTIIQTNGFLIGLSGVVFAQMFWAINHQQSTIQADLIQNPSATDADDFRIHYVNALDKKRRNITLVMLVVVLFFLISIALSLSGMAKTQSYETSLAPTTDIINPFLYMVLGIVFFMFSITTSKMSFEEEIKELKKSKTG